MGLDGDHPSNKVNHLNVVPNPGQALGDQAAVAVLRGGLAAEQATHALREQRPIKGVRDAAVVHQGLEARHISFPVVVLAIVIANLGRRCQFWEVDVARAVEALQKPSKVILFCEPRELPAGFETDIDDLFDPMLGEEFEKALG